VKILLSSNKFYPNLGGLETVSALLAREFTGLGQDVVVVTETPHGGAEDTFSYKVVRCPPARELVGLVRWADLVFHNNISLRAAWPLLLVRRPWVVAHHIWVPRGLGSQGLKGSVKRAVLHGATGIAISDAIAADFSSPCVVIPDPYDDEVFRPLPEIKRTRDLVFVGRFVSDKGLPVLFEALTRLAGSGLRPTLTVIGAGPEEQAWRGLAEGALAKQVEFAGVKRGADLAEVLNAHRVMVIPSIWNEPFGVVALEGMACGCVVIGSEGGGLKQAIGPAGLTVANGDSAGFAAAIAQVLGDPKVQEHCRAAAPAHLALHRPATVAKRYLEVFERAAA
jgi:glycosyltransferase involved in cell wall biosynthesis